MTSLDQLVVQGSERPRRQPWLRRVLRDPAATAGGVLLCLIVLAVGCAGWFAPQGPLRTDVPHRLAPFSWAHPLGTDGIGRDTLSRILYGGRLSLLITLAVVLIVTVVGLAVGVTLGMCGGAVDALGSRMIELIQAVPLVIVSLATISLLGGGSDRLILVLGAVGWTGQARVVRAMTLSLREQPFVESSRAAGGSRRRVAVRHVVPNVLGSVAVLATFDVGRVLLTVSTLSYLGFGPHPPAPEWGSMLAEAAQYFFSAPRLLVIPGVAIGIVALAANLFGEGLRDAFEIRTAKE